MAWLSADASFDPDTLNTPLIGVQSTLNGDHDDGLHRHQMGQMLFTRQGCIRLTLNDGALLCMLPPTRAAWIPAGVTHRAQMQHIVDYRSVWFANTHYPELPAAPAILNVTPLLRELLERISASPWDTDWQQGPARHLAAQCGAGEKTISRLFQRETGMSYQQWRQQWRLMKAVELLASGQRITDVAQALEFASDSAFIYFFRSQTGKPPGQYIAR